MNSGTPPSRCATAWISVLLAVLMLYVASWPPVELGSARWRQMVVLGTVFGLHGDDAELFINRVEFEQPRWLKTLYHPLHRISDVGAKRNFLFRYWVWWSGRFGMVPSTIDYGKLD